MQKSGPSEVQILIIFSRVGSQKCGWQFFKPRSADSSSRGKCGNKGNTIKIVLQAYIEHLAVVQRFQVFNNCPHSVIYS
mgnify:CR=1 FL=1